MTKSQYQMMDALRAGIDNRRSTFSSSIITFPFGQPQRAKMTLMHKSTPILCTEYQQSEY